MGITKNQQLTNENLYFLWFMPSRSTGDKRN